jgi:ABC-type branched-subunit amino acid transport system ATPase component
MREPILELKNVSAAYGRIKAIKASRSKSGPGEIVSTGSVNGAGKTPRS